MDDSEAYMDIQLVTLDSWSPPRTESDVSQVEINFQNLSAPRVRTNRDGLNSNYSELSFRKEKTRIDEDDDPPINSGPGGLSSTAQTAAQELGSKVKIGNRPNCLICLLCLVTSALIVIVAGLSIHVSQIRESNETCYGKYFDLNSTLQSKISESSHLNLSQRTCVKNVSALNSDLAVLKRMHSDLRHQFIEMETKYRSVNDTKVRICEWLTRRREQTCSEDWVTHKDRCYYVSTLETSFARAKQECSNRDSRLLEISSRDGVDVFNAIVPQYGSYWIGKCEAGEVASSVLFKQETGTSTCGNCNTSGWEIHCNRQQPFLCEKSAHSFTDIPEKIRDLCQQSARPT